MNRLGLMVGALGLFTVAFSIPSAHAVTLEEEVQDRMNAELIESVEQVTFERFQSCEAMDTVLTRFLKDNEEYFKQPRYMLYDDVMVMESTDMAKAESSIAASDSELSGGSGGSADFSTTNVQEGGVDENDILKVNGTHLYYLNDQKSTLDVYTAPVGGETPLANARRIRSITLPKELYNKSLMLHDETLVVLGTRYSQLQSRNGGSNEFTAVALYDISTPETPSLRGYHESEGSFVEARMIDGHLYTASRYYVDWYSLYSQDDIEVRSILPTQYAAVPTTTATSTDAGTTVAGKSKAYSVTATHPTCDGITYALPDSEALDSLGQGGFPSFVTIQHFDLMRPEIDPTVSVTLGSVDTVYMSQNAMYLLGGSYGSFSRRGGSSQSLLHAIDRSGITGGLTYRTSARIPGSPLNQYSLSEDTDGNLRLLTQSFANDISTHLFVLSPELTPVGVLGGIEPGEEFKASRYIGDKLYLVTFERTDPLFAIDLADPTTPTILGEAIIPGFSTYLHPRGPLTDGIQYLVGVGYDTAENQWGGTVTGGIKVDLYKIDYTTTQADGTIPVTQEYTKTFGDEGSASEAATNPRSVVRNNATKTLQLPLYLSSKELGEECNIEYNSQREIVRENCYETTLLTPEFLGMKTLLITPLDGIVERFSSNQLDYFEEALTDTGSSRIVGDLPSEQIEPAFVDPQFREQQLNQWMYSQLGSRVGYYGEIVYRISSELGWFGNPRTQEYRMIEQ